MKTYTTIQGDMWDTIAHKQMGSSMYVGQLITANIKYCGIFLFPAGIELTIPDVDVAASLVAPPWKQVSG